MSITKTYKCDLCREVKDKNELVCLYWKSDIIPQQYIFTRAVDLADKHLCPTCIDLIKNLEIPKP